jgi:endonuclease I
VLALATLFASQSFGQYDPPVGYYSSATGTGATLKSQLHDIIDDHTVLPYNDSSAPYHDTRTALQITDDATPNNPNDDVIRLVYDGVMLDVSNLNGPPPGWNNGGAWDREHTWPRSRGIEESGADNTDLHHLMPSTPMVNSNRGNRNFGGAFGQPFGVVTDVAAGMWYPGDADAGRIARAQFYMAVRYDGSDSSTTDLELTSGNPGDGGTTLGSLDRMVEWHFVAPPTEFERRRNHIIDTQFQHNRNPFVDRPEFVWSVFVDNANDSRVTINGTSPDANGGSTRNVDLGRVFTGTAVPAAQAFTLNKAGAGGTYFEVTTSGAATSSITGRYNAFLVNPAGDSKSINVGLNTNTATAGLRSGMVTINNLDVTTGGGAGRGANDANDTFNVSLTVLDHATASFENATTQLTKTLNFGTLTTASAPSALNFSVFNRNATAGFTANMDFDSIVGSGDTSALTTNAAVSAGSLVLAGGNGQMFTATIDTSMVGIFSAAYMLNFSDENIAGAQNDILTLNLVGQVLLAGDFNRDNLVDSADYIIWRKSYGQSVAAYDAGDGDGDSFVDDDDFIIWREHFGETASGSGGFAPANVPEPASALLAMLFIALLPRCRSKHSV